MTATTSTQVAGVQDAIKALRKIDPELRKQFNRDVKQIVAPVIDAAGRAYPEHMLSGMERKWTQRDSAKFPYSQKKAQRGVKPKIDTSRKTLSVIKVRQTDPAAVIVEFAGKGSSNPLGRALNKFAQPARFMWPAAIKELPAVTREMTSAVMAVIRQADKELH